MLLHEIVYISEVSDNFKESDLEDILKTSRDYNKKKGITGLLLYKNGAFLQAFEGERENVITLLETIREDTRHKNVTKLLSQPLETRHFENWSMGFYNVQQLKHLEKLPEFSRFMHPNLDVKALEGRGRKALEMLIYFRGAYPAPGLSQNSVNT